MRNRVIQEDSFTRLPIDVFINVILSYFDPVFIAKSLSLINTYFNFYINSNDFWLSKLELHFPHRLDLYEKMMKSIDQKVLTINARAEFIKAYQYDYKNLSLHDRILYSIAKENNDVNWFDNGKLIQIPFDSLQETDTSNHGLLFWIKKNKMVMDNLYQTKKKVYTNENQILDTKSKDHSHRTIFYWALVLNQDLEEIKFLLQQGSQIDEQYYDMLRPIHIAAREGRLDVLEFILLENPDLVNSNNLYNETPVMLAAANGHLSTVQYLCQHPRINLKTTSVRQRNGRNALHYAAENGHDDIASVLLRAGIDANLTTAPDSSGLTYLPLHYAAKSGNLDLVARLIQLLPQTIDAPDYFGQTPFLWAAAKGYLRIIQYLINLFLNEKASINFNVATNTMADSNAGKNALHWAAQNGHFAVVLELIKMGINNNRTNAGELPIHLAARGGHLEIVIAFINLDPTLLNVPDKQGNTLLIYAAKGGHFKLLQFLLTQPKIDIHAKTYLNDYDSNHTAIHFAVKGKKIEIVRELLKAGADVNQHDRSNHQNFPIHFAIHYNNLEIVKLLIDHQPNLLNLCNSNGTTPLMFAIHLSDLSIAKYFLWLNDTKKIALDVNAKKIVDNRAALHLAAENGAIDIIKPLLKAGATQTPTKQEGTYPIHFACAIDRFDIVELLVEEKPEMLNITNKFGYTPLMIAAKNGCLKTVNYLVNNESKNNRLNIFAKSNGFADEFDNGKTALHLAADRGNDPIVNILLNKGAGKSFDPARPVSTAWWFSRLSVETKNKIKRLENKNKNKATSQFNHAFNFYATSFNNRDATPSHLEFETNQSLKRIPK